MFKMRVRVTIFIILVLHSIVKSQCVSLTTLSSPYSQDFNTLSNTAGSTTNNLTITGWFLTESGGGARDNEQYAVDTGASNTGDMFSYGSASATDRSIGGLRSGTLIPTFGSCFTNNTGSTISSLNISLVGEEWRLGTASRTDQIDFQYSLNATDLSTGTWVDVNALDFITPNTTTAGAKDGNATGNKTSLSATINSLSIPNGATFWIRWTDLDASGADDGLAVDDFSLTPNGCTPLTPNITGPTSVCSGGNVTLNAGSGYSAYAWSNSGGAAQSAMFSNITSNTTYSVTVTDANGCTGTDTHSVTVNANPTPTITGPTSVCSGGSVTLDAGSYALYDWSNGGGSNQTANFMNITTMTTYTVTVVDNNTCLGTDSHTVSINSLPTATAGSNSPVCPKTTLTLTGGANGNSYSWSGPDMFSSMNQNPTIPNVSASKAGIYTLTVTDGNMCTNTASTTVVVNPVPVILPLATARCSNAQWGFGLPATTQNGVPVNALSVRTLTAAPGLTLISSQIPPVLPATGLAAAITLPEVWQNPTSNPLDVIYTVSATADGLCYGDSVEVKVTINPLPTAMISGASTICANQTSTLTASGGSTYVWSNGGMTNSINVGIGSYSVTATDGNGCTDTESYNINQNNTGNNGTSGIYESYVVMNTTGSNTYYDLQNPTVNPDFNGFNLGSFQEGGSALINGGEIKTYKNNPANICGGRIYYSVYPSAGMPGSFTSINLPFAANLGGPNQQWSNTTSNNNFLSSLTPGMYKIAVYVDASGDGLNPTTCGCDPLHVQNNTGAFWIADFTVTSACAPIDAGTISGDNSLCVGEVTTLTTNGDMGGTWSSSDEDVATVDNTGEVTALMEGPTIIKYKVFGAMSCPDDSATFNLTVNPNPSASVNITETSGIANGDGVICNGASVTLTASGGTSYLWDNGITNGVAFSPVDTTTYNVTVTDANGCSATESETINVNSLPTASISIVESSGNSSNDGILCSGSSVTLSGGGANTYIWNNMVTNGVSFIPGGTTVYTVTATDNNGCSDTETATIFVNSLPTATISKSETSGNINNDGIICSGASVTLSGGGASTYSWNNGVTNAVSFTPGGTTTYTVTATDINGCKDTEIVTITVNSLPTAVINISETSGNTNNDDTICSGAFVTLSGGGANTYSWNNGVTNAVAFTPAGTTTYTVTATDNNGCSDTESTTITVNTLPTAIVNISENSGTTNNDGTICEGSTVTLSGGGASSYSWDLGVIDGVAFIPNGTTTFTLTATDLNGCSDTEIALVTVNTLPDAFISLNNSPSCEGTIAKFTISGTPDAEVQYNINGGSNVPDTLDNAGELNVQVPMGSFDITLYLTNVRNTNTNCSKPLVLSSTVVVIDTSVTNFNITTCNSYIWPENGSTYTASAIDTVNLYKINGCDSLIILNLTLNNSEYDTSFVTSCSNYFWSVDGNTYSMSGTYIYESTNMLSTCQDTSVLVLTIGTSNVYNPNDPNCYTNITDALQNANPGDTIFINGGTYLEGFEIPFGVVLQINPGGVVNNTAGVCNMGTIILNGGQFINTSAYQGRGIFIGNFVNTNTGSVAPKVCGN